MAMDEFTRCPACEHVLAETNDAITVTRDGTLLAKITVLHGVDSGFVAVAHNGAEITRERVATSLRLQRGKLAHR